MIKGMSNQREPLSGKVAKASVALDRASGEPDPFLALAGLLDSGVNYTDFAPLMAKRTELSDQIRDAWAQKHELTRCDGRQTWMRLIKRSHIPVLHESLPHDDHCSLWQRGSTPIAWVSQPYGVYDVAEMVAAAERHGLEFTISARSWWYPGATLLVVWTKAGVSL
jgi:hypothetical protein